MHPDTLRVAFPRERDCIGNRRDSEMASLDFSMEAAANAIDMSHVGEEPCGYYSVLAWDVEPGSSSFGCWVAVTFCFLLFFPLS